MKAKLIFDLSNPDDTLEFERVNKSLAMACALFDILQLRKKLEREEESNMSLQSEGIFVGIEKMSETIGEILEKYNINIDELIQ